MRHSEAHAVCQQPGISQALSREGSLFHSFVLVFRYLLKTPTLCLPPCGPLNLEAYGKRCAPVFFLSISNPKWLREALLCADYDLLVKQHFNAAFQTENDLRSYKAAAGHVNA